jgi:flagellar biosynthetic protein FlhB
MARKRMMTDVPKADVVITNPTHIAVALRYAPDAMLAPVVVAKGAGHIAERIKKIAREHGVMIIEQPLIARSLYKLVAIGREVPADLYRAVAEILAIVYRAKRMTPDGRRMSLSAQEVRSPWPQPTRRPRHRPCCDTRTFSCPSGSSAC